MPKKVTLSKDKTVFKTHAFKQSYVCKQGHCKVGHQDYANMLSACAFTCSDGKCNPPGIDKCQDKKMSCPYFKKTVGHFPVTLNLLPYSQPLYGHILQGACKPDSKYFSGTVDDCPFSCTDGSCKRGGNAKCQDKSYGCSVYKQQVDYEQFNIIQRSIKIKNFYNLDSLFELISPQCWIKHGQITNIFWITPCVI